MRAAALSLAALGTLIAGYLVLAGGEPACVIAHGCSVVQNSRYAELGGVPVAALGLAAYVAILFATLHDRELTRMAAATTALIGTGFSAWLTYVEVAKLDAICTWCVASAVCMTALGVVTAVRVAR